jgi:hypothetical protein
MLKTESGITFIKYAQNRTLLVLILLLPDEGYSTFCFEHTITWWRLFHFLFWAYYYLMKVFPLSVLSVLDEGYSTFSFEHTITWWRLFHFLFWAYYYLMKVIQKPSSSTLKTESGITFIRYAQNRKWDNLHPVRSKQKVE